AAEDLVAVYLERMRPDIAGREMDRLRPQLDELVFVWAGSTDRGERHYYRLTGPTFLAEYDNTQDNANHVHAVWRDLARDFGDADQAPDLRVARRTPRGGVVDDRLTDMGADKARNGLDRIVVLAELDVPRVRFTWPRQVHCAVVEPERERLGLDRSFGAEVVG